VAGTGSLGGSPQSQVGASSPMAPAADPQLELQRLQALVAVRCCDRTRGGRK
jgi:hypothetical protein